jgi:TfoX/Sxy family transcriptional regulator of competence genes
MLNKIIKTMAYSEQLADRIRERLSGTPAVEEKEMMGGLTFMVNGKMCVGIIKDELMCRIDPALYESALEKRGCRQMDFTGKPMKGWVMVDEMGIERTQDLYGWIDLALAFNAQAKPHKRKK